jgi:hypothetical protein
MYYLCDSYGLVLWGALSDERTSLSFVYAAGPCQRSLSRVRVTWDSRPYFAVSDLRLPISSPPTTRRVTVEVFDPASTRVTVVPSNWFSYIDATRIYRKHVSRDRMRGADHIKNTASSTVAKARLQRRCLPIEVTLLRARMLRECVSRPAA